MGDHINEMIQTQVAEQVADEVQKSFIDRVKNIEWEKEFFGWKVKDLAIALGIMVSILIVIWVIFIVGAIWPQARIQMFIHGAIWPRVPSGLVGIFTSSFLHADYVHIASNSGPLFVLGFVLLLRGRKEFLVVTLVVMLIGDFCLWVVGRGNALYIGASGVIFGWFGYILSVAFFERPIQWYSVILAAIVFVMYAGMIFGVFPTFVKSPGEAEIAWESHLISAVVGIIASFVYFYVTPKAIEFYNARFPNGLFPKKDGENEVELEGAVDDISLDGDSVSVALDSHDDPFAPSPSFEKYSINQKVTPSTASIFDTPSTNPFDDATPKLYATSNNSSFSAFDQAIDQALAEGNNRKSGNTGGESYFYNSLGI